VGEPAPDLDALLRDELFQPVPEAARLLSEEIRRRCGAGTAAVVFYGSCLRKQTDEGVLDFYVIVDDYRGSSPSRAIAWLGAALPPNVFYIELRTGGGGSADAEILRAKYAMMSREDFARATRPANLRPSIWARFSQPALAAWVRDDDARELLVRCARRSVLTALSWALPMLPDDRGTRRFDAESLWQRVFAETYASEMRPESRESIQSLFQAAPGRFDAVTRAGLAAFAAERGVSACWDGAPLEVTLPEDEALSTVQRWRRRRPLAKAVYLLQLLKTAVTFGDWLPYALWKLERHTGVKLEPSERQRRHPLIYGWPLAFRVLWRRELR
jgi:hypothetical protein